MVSDIIGVCLGILCCGMDAAGMYRTFDTQLESLLLLLTMQSLGRGLHDASATAYSHAVTSKRIGRRDTVTHISQNE